MTLQTQIDFARKATNAGIQKALDSANRKQEDWGDKAYDYLQAYVRTRKAGERFMAEDIRQDAGTLLSEPPSLRAWGAIVRKALFHGVMIRVGYATVKNIKAHKAMAAVFVKN
jgi:hypothetical protein